MQPRDPRDVIYYKHLGRPRIQQGRLCDGSIHIQKEGAVIDHVLLENDIGNCVIPKGPETEETPEEVEKAKKAYDFHEDNPGIPTF
uniref:Uncharacterized protein n=1 Tax=Megaselia scalaris TaxID=36166 RepID=T1GEZ4_MEGSC